MVTQPIDCTISGSIHCRPHVGSPPSFYTYTPHGTTETLVGGTHLWCGSEPQRFGFRDGSQACSCDDFWKIAPTFRDANCRFDSGVTRNRYGLRSSEVTSS